MTRSAFECVTQRLAGSSLAGPSPCLPANRRALEHTPLLLTKSRADGQFLRLRPRRAGRLGRPCAVARDLPANRRSTCSSATTWRDWLLVTEGEVCHRTAAVAATDPNRFPGCHRGRASSSATVRATIRLNCAMMTAAPKSNVRLRSSLVEWYTSAIQRRS